MSSYLLHGEQGRSTCITLLRSGRILRDHLHCMLLEKRLAEYAVVSASAPSVFPYSLYGALKPKSRNGYSMYTISISTGDHRAARCYTSKHECACGAIRTKNSKSLKLRVHNHDRSKPKSSKTTCYTRIIFRDDRTAGWIRSWNLGS